MEPVGCRTLRYREHDVALICFKRGERLMHLFVVDETALPNLPARSSQKFIAEGSLHECADAVQIFALDVGHACLLRGVADDQKQEWFLVRGATEDAI